MIYINSTISGKFGDNICQFSDKRDLLSYACERGIYSNYWENIPTILDALYDTHITTNFGSVTHQRISRIDAIKAIKNGATNHTFL
jgi:hypothetical protein